jgi:hypothetical protein
MDFRNYNEIVEYVDQTSEEEIMKIIGRLHIEDRIIITSLITQRIPIDEVESFRLEYTEEFYKSALGGKLFYLDNKNIITNNAQTYFDLIKIGISPSSFDEIGFIEHQVDLYEYILDYTGKCDIRVSYNNEDGTFEFEDDISNILKDFNYNVTLDTIRDELEILKGINTNISCKLVPVGYGFALFTDSSQPASFVDMFKDISSTLETIITSSPLTGAIRAGVVAAAIGFASMGTSDTKIAVSDYIAHIDKHISPLALEASYNASFSASINHSLENRVSYEVNIGGYSVCGESSNIKNEDMSQSLYRLNGACDCGIDQNTAKRYASKIKNNINKLLRS